MASWLVYWTPENVEEFEGQANFRMDCLGSGVENFGSKFSKGDTVWIHSIDSTRYHSILGKLTLAEYVTSREKAENRIERHLSNVRFTNYWIAEKPWNSIKDVPFSEVPYSLEFESGKKLPSDYSGKHFQSPRRLTEEDNLLILDLWNAWTE